MLRSISGVILGYVVMAIFIMGTFTALFFGLGTERSFMPGSFEPSMIWNVASVVLGLIAAVVGGVVCVLIARQRGAAQVLAGMVLVLGLAMAVGPLLSDAPDPGPREGDLNNFEAMSKAQSPTWMLIANPIIGAVGVLIGARLVSPRDSGDAA